MCNFKLGNENFELKIWDLEFESEYFILNPLQEFSFLSFFFFLEIDMTLLFSWIFLEEEKKRKEKKKSQRKRIFFGVD